MQDLISVNIDLASVCILVGTKYVRYFYIRFLTLCSVIGILALTVDLRTILSESQRFHVTNVMCI